MEHIQIVVKSWYFLNSCGSESTTFFLTFFGGAFFWEIAAEKVNGNPLIKERTTAALRRHRTAVN